VLCSLPSSGIDFEYCSVKQLETKSFTMSNPSSSTVRYSIETGENEDFSPTAFEIEPKQGVLKPGGK
jgi:hypothetical protein